LLGDDGRQWHSGRQWHGGRRGYGGRRRYGRKLGGVDGWAAEASCSVVTQQWLLIQIQCKALLAVRQH